jgi:hypothetical protein
LFFIIIFLILFEKVKHMTNQSTTQRIETNHHSFAQSTRFENRYNLLAKNAPEYGRMTGLEVSPRCEVKQMVMMGRRGKQ